MSSIKIFENEMFGKIRVAGTSDEPLFCLADICRVLELQVTPTKNRLKQDGVSLIKGVSKTTNQHGVTTEQEVKLTFISEQNLYRVIMRSDKPQAEPFQDWVCGEVLPSIRKTGGYMTARKDETPEQIMARALLLAKETIDRQQTALKHVQSENKELHKQNEALLPGATFAKAVETSEHSILVGELARIIRQNGVQIGQNRLFNWLRENGYLCKKGESYNQPTQKGMDMGLFEIKKTVITKASGESIVKTTTKVTGKGQIYFVNAFLREMYEAALTE